MPTVAAPALSDDGVPESSQRSNFKLELSTKCDTSEAFQVGAESRAFLAERDITIGGAQTTKTRKALEFFSKQLRPA